MLCVLVAFASHSLDLKLYPVSRWLNSRVNLTRQHFWHVIPAFSHPMTERSYEIRYYMCCYQSIPFVILRYRYHSTNVDFQCFSSANRYFICLHMHSTNTSNIPSRNQHGCCRCNGAVALSHIIPISSGAWAHRVIYEHQFTCTTPSLSSSSVIARWSGLVEICSSSQKYTEAHLILTPYDKLSNNINPSTTTVNIFLHIFSVFVCSRIYLMIKSGIK